MLLPLSLYSDNREQLSQTSTGHQIQQTAAPKRFTLPLAAAKAIEENSIKKITPPLSSTVKSTLFYILNFLFTVMAIAGGIPLVVFFIEYNLSGFHAFHNHFKKCKNYLPNVAVIIPAWNEEFVLEHTINLLLKIDYPLSALRLYVVDDGSTDSTVPLLTQLHAEHPDNVIHIRKEGGGKGKAHAVNYGLDIVLSDDWAEAILFIDADVSFKKDALRRLTRHLADPEVGAVTAYIKEGTRNANFITRSIGYEYIASQSIARRAQNVLGVVSCLAGGAQLHTRANIELLGSRIDTSTLAEDTFTTLETQKLGKKVIFEGNAFVYAEEPKSITEVWKQRFRWARGNIQITRAFKSVWFRHKKSPLGGFLFGIIWFSVLLAPLLMISSSLGLLGLFIINKKHSAQIFYYLVNISFFVYLYTTLFAFMVDRRTSRIAWFEGIVYPGLISLLILFIAVNSNFFLYHLDIHYENNTSFSFNDAVLLFMETWSGMCMFWAWIVFRLELAGVSKRITNFLIIIVGYGPLLCTINLFAYMAEIKHFDMKWDKTEKLGVKRILRDRIEEKTVFDFDKALIKDMLREYRFFGQELLSLTFIFLLFYFFYFKS